MGTAAAASIGNDPTSEEAAETTRQRIMHFLYALSPLSLLGRIPVARIYMLSSVCSGCLGSVQRHMRISGPWAIGPSSLRSLDHHGPEILMGLWTLIAPRDAQESSVAGSNLGSKCQVCHVCRCVIVYISWYGHSVGVWRHNFYCTLEHLGEL